ncbi:MAG: phospholipase D-like domain-containing protein [Bdellovibrionota bacterium]
MIRKIILLVLIMAAGPSFAQNQCATVLLTSGLGAPRPLHSGKAVISSKYLSTISVWEKAWRNNVFLKMFGGKYKAPSDLDLNIDDFNKSREFRSWFEKHNRMEFGKLEKQDASLANIKYLPSGPEALAAKLLAIRQAKYTIDMAYFIIENDDTGLAVLGELKNALRRGVSIRIMTDALGNQYNNPKTYLRSLIEVAENEAGYRLDLNGNPTSTKATLEMVDFNPAKAIPLNMIRSVYRDAENLVRKFFKQQPIESLGYSFNRRSHDKILLIDGAFTDRAVGFLGGRNLGNQNHNIGKIGDITTVDAELMLKGLPATDMTRNSDIGVHIQEYFDQIYFHLGNTIVTKSLLGRIIGYEKFENRMDRAHARVTNKLGIDVENNELRMSLMEQGFDQQEVEVANTFHNIFRREADRKVELREHKLAVKNSRSLITALTEAIKKEDQEITIVSPYMWMSKRQILLIKKWLLHDPNRRLNIITNSLMTNDGVLTPVLVDSVLAPNLLLDKGIVKDGVEIRRSISNQVKIHLYGRADDKMLGGSADYGMLHMKAILLKGSKTVSIGTFNNDPRSLLLNSEGTAITTGEAIANQVSNHIDQILKDTHEWGSAEYHQMREHPGLPLAKQVYAKKYDLFYRTVMKLNLWWLL